MTGTTTLPQLHVGAMNGPLDFMGTRSIVWGSGPDRERRGGSTRRTGSWSLQYRHQPSAGCPDPASTEIYIFYKIYSKATSWQEHNAWLSVGEIRWWNVHNEVVWLFVNLDNQRHRDWIKMLPQLNQKAWKSLIWFMANFKLTEPQ